MDLELDLTSLGLRPASERTLGALKRSAAAAATATRPALGAQSSGSGPARAAATLVPPSPQLAAGLDALAGLGSPVRPPKPPPAGATHTRNVSVDDLLGDLLSPPPPPARPHGAACDRAAKSTPAPRLGEALDPFFGAPPLAARPTPQAQRPAESALDDLESFAAGVSTQRGAAEAPASPPPPPPRPARSGSGGAASPVVRRASVGATAHAADFLAGASSAAAGAAAAVAAAAAAAFMRAAPDEDDDFFAGGTAPPSPSVPARPIRRASSGDACLAAAAEAAHAPPQPQPAVADPDDLDFFAGGAAAAAAVAAEAPAQPAPPVFGGLDDLAAAPRAGGAVSTDPLDALFARAAPAAGASRHGGTGAVAAAAAGAPRPRTDVSRWGTPVTSADVAAAVDASVFANQGDNEVIDPNEPPERAALRRKRHEAARQRVEDALREKLERDALAAAEAQERHAVSAQVGPRLEAWTRVGKGNIRLYLTSVQDVLWEGHTWKPIGMTDLVAPDQVKRAWKRVLVNIHPDKVQQKGGTAAQRLVADKVFHTMLDAYNAFADKELA